MQQFSSQVVDNAMMTARTSPSGSNGGEGTVVRSPRVTDAVGTALRQVFTPAGALLPADMQHALQRIDRRA